MRILVVRNDKLGDFMLAWPAFALLRASLPGAVLHALVPAYTAPIARLCPALDDVVIDPGAAAGWRGRRELLARLRAGRYDAALVLFSTTRIGWLLARAGIRYRLAPATKVAQVFYRRRLRQRRSESAKPEYEYNLDLARALLADHGATPAALPPPPYLRFDDAERAQADRALRAAHGIPETHRLVFVHPGSGGSARNLSILQYAEVVAAIRPARPFTAVVTAGPGELKAAETLANDIRCRGRAAVVLPPGGDLPQFALRLSLAAVFVSGSTGPLHVAAALDRPTCAFFPRRRSATALRWQTVNAAGNRLAFMPPEGAGEEEMSAIDAAAAGRAIAERWLRP